MFIFTYCNLYCSWTTSLEIIQTEDHTWSGLEPTLRRKRTIEAPRCQSCRVIRWWIAGWALWIGTTKTLPMSMSSPVPFSVDLIATTISTTNVGIRRKPSRAPTLTPSQLESSPSLPPMPDQLAVFILYLNKPTVFSFSPHYVFYYIVIFWFVFLDVRV